MAYTVLHLSGALYWRWTITRGAGRGTQRRRHMDPFPTRRSQPEIPSARNIPGLPQSVTKALHEGLDTRTRGRTRLLVASAGREHQKLRTTAYHDHLHGRTAMGEIDRPLESFLDQIEWGSNQTLADLGRIHEQILRAMLSRVDATLSGPRPPPPPPRPARRPPYSITELRDFSALLLSSSPGARTD